MLSKYVTPATSCPPQSGGGALGESGCPLNAPWPVISADRPDFTHADRANIASRLAISADRPAFTHADRANIASRLAISAANLLLLSRYARVPDLSFPRASRGMMARKVSD